MPERMAKPWAARRDASWYDHPNASSFKVVHVADPDGMSCCGRCPLDDKYPMPIEEVPEPQPAIAPQA